MMARGRGQVLRQPLDLLSVRRRFLRRQKNGVARGHFDESALAPALYHACRPEREERQTNGGRQDDQKPCHGGTISGRWLTVNWLASPLPAPLREARPGGLSGGSGLRWRGSSLSLIA